MDAATVRAAGRLDSVTAPQLRLVLDAALQHARLVAINLREVSFVDSTGRRLLVDATRRAHKRGSRLVVMDASAEVERSFALAETRALLDVLPGALGSTPNVAREPIDGVDPLRNPVNARIVTARVMDTDARALWTHGADGTIRRAWAPDAFDGTLMPPGARVEIYLDQHGAVNGWWHTSSRLAINQRHLAAVDGGPEFATGALVCQGSCELLWQAPAAAQVLGHDERCLTCAGPLALA
ncbi:STAS domain-containing protein [Solirubrobacter sp. CPCC 204708]|uniref:STAS domain-containing protein n=1 Tax=Solirubrobacter deserti TaxID=2282478 RepID=A0ABT4RLF6_9ACTN|nr:STAS domain-containing protein [Solirubrobacter deserti]MBE2320415.1 STAS domain-containing protein [Solirubrobacter deserti]MDA0139394.1 STAS domain-containing protein [Solirubrobacter deserti]